MSMGIRVSGRAPSTGDHAAMPARLGDSNSRMSTRDHADSGLGYVVRLGEDVWNDIAGLNCKFALRRSYMCVLNVFAQILIG